MILSVNNILQVTAISKACGGFGSLKMLGECEKVKKLAIYFVYALIYTNFAT